MPDQKLAKNILNKEVIVKADESAVSTASASAARQDEIQLTDVWIMLMRQKKVIFVTLCFALICAIAFLALVPKEWEGTAIIRIGQVGRVAPDHPQSIEPIDLAIDRMKLTSVFQNQVLNGLNIPVDSSEAIFIRKHITFEARQSGVIEMKVTAHTPNDARVISEAMVKHLVDIHSKLAELQVASLKIQSNNIANQLQDALSEREKSIQGVVDMGRTGIGKTAGEVALLGSVAGSSQNYVIRDLQRSEFEIDDQLGSAITYPTQLLESVAISDEPVFPSKSLVWALALILGLVIGSLIACFRDSRVLKNN